MKNDYIFVTKQGLIDFEDILEQRYANYFRNRKAATDSSIERSIYNVTDVYEREIIKPTIESETIDGHHDD